MLTEVADDVDKSPSSRGRRKHVLELATCKQRAFACAPAARKAAAIASAPDSADTTVPCQLCPIRTVNLHCDLVGPLAEQVAA